MFLFKYKKFIYQVAIVLAIVLFYFLTQFSTYRIIGNDGHFHIRYSNTMLERGVPDKLSELKYTTWGESYRDYHFLFHVLSIPFSLIPDIRIGGKVAAATFASFAAIVFFFFITVFKFRFPLVWLTLFMVGSSGFLFRMQMPRVQSVALVLLLLIIWAFLKQKNLTLLILGFINVWLYDSFLLLFAIAGAYVLSERLTFKKWQLKSVVYLLIGIFIGTIINPFFPNNYISYYESIWRMFAPFGSIPLPSEWHSELGWDIIKNNASLIIIGIVLSVTALVYSEQKKKICKQETSEHLFFLLLMFIFTAMLFKSRRFIEYAMPINILFIGIACRDLIPSFDRDTVKIFRFVIGFIVFIFGFGVIWNFLQTTKTDEIYRCYMNAGKWLNKNSKQGEVVFPSDWDDFPILYMNAPKLDYVVGLDPLFMKMYDEDLYSTYVNITLGKFDGLYSNKISEKFTSKYIFTDVKDHADFIKHIDKEKNVYRVFSEKACRIYQIGK